MAQKVLVVDDVSMFLELQKEFLHLAAVNVLTARDGQEALKICQRERPNLVVMDLHMPVMNGAECCRALKKDRQLSETRVILVTSEGKEEDRSTCLAAGCDEFLTKPLDRQIYLAKARKLLPGLDRREKRVACHIRTKFRAFGITLSGTILDLSHNGAYLATECTMDRGAVIDLIFALPDPHSAIVQVQGRVAWINTRESRKREGLVEGVGIEFQSPSEETAATLARFFEAELDLT